MDVLDRPGDEALSPVVQVALAYRAVIKDRGTLASTDSAEYRSAVRAMRWTEGRERKWIAELLRISPSAVTKLLGPRPVDAPEGAAA